MQVEKGRKEALHLPLLMKVRLYGVAHQRWSSIDMLWQVHLQAMEKVVVPHRSKSGWLKQLFNPSFRSFAMMAHM
jgi:hypothetical protein